MWAVEDVKFWDENLIAKFSVQDLLNCFRTRGALHVKKGSLWVDGGEDRCKGQRCRENGCSHLEQHQRLQLQGATLVMREERKGFGEKGLDV